ncbi:MAG: polysaccharide deacetylase family protein [Paracoccaceae bacterium]
MLTVTFDDASMAQFNHGFEIVRDLEIPGSVFVVSGFAEDAANGDYSRRKGFIPMGWDHIREFHAIGWEIASHSQTHPHLWDLAPDAVERELTASKAQIEQNTGTSPVSFASPYGHFNEAVVEQIKQHYGAHARAWGGAEGFNVIGQTDPHLISRLDVLDHMDAEFICGKIDRAIARGNWLVLIFHEFVDGPPEEFQLSKAEFATMMRCARDRADDDALRLVTLKEGADLSREAGTQ